MKSAVAPSPFPVHVFVLLSSGCGGVSPSFNCLRCASVDLFVVLLPLIQSSKKKPKKTKTRPKQHHQQTQNPATTLNEKGSAREKSDFGIGELAQQGQDARATSQRSASRCSEGGCCSPGWRGEFCAASGGDIFRAEAALEAVRDDPPELGLALEMFSCGFGAVRLGLADGRQTGCDEAGLCCEGRCGEQPAEVQVATREGRGEPRATTGGISGISAADFRPRACSCGTRRGALPSEERFGKEAPVVPAG